MFGLTMVAGLGGSAHYLTWGWVQISVPNLVVIVLMIVLFVLALLLPFPKGRDEEGGTK
jgi:hypothetical protein